MRLLSALSHRAFALLWTGRTISSLGDGIFLIALSWWVIKTTGSAAANGVILICTSAPMLLLLLVGGVIVDRLPRRALLLTADLVSGIVVLVVAALAQWNLLAFWQLALLGVVFGVVQAFFYPAYTSIVPEITPAETLPSANSLASLSAQAAGVLGPALGGILIALGGTSLAFALDGVTFFISAVLLFVMPATPAISASSGEHSEAENQERAPGILGDLREGVSTVLRMPWLWITIAVAGVSNIVLSGPLEAVLPLLVRQHLGGNVGVYALLNTLFALGAVVAAIALGQAKKLHHRGLLVYIPWLASAAALVVMGLPVTVVGVCLAIFICGAGITALGLVWANTLQEMVPLDKLGRVSSIDALGSYALLPIGYGLSGLVADHIGSAPVFVIGGALSAAIIALGLLHPAVRLLD